MVINDNTEHFVSMEDMPEFDASTPVLDVYRKLAEVKRGGFIIKGADSQRFVKAEELARKSMIDSAKDVHDIVAEAQETIGQLCDNPKVASAIIDVETDPVTDDADPVPLQAQPDDKVYVVTSGSELTGYFLNHESVLDPATKRVHYVCENNHRNPDPDHGSCYSCPGKIVRTEQE